MPMWFLQPSHQMLYGISNLRKRQDLLLLFLSIKRFLTLNHLAMCVWRSEDDFQEMVVSFCFVGLGTELGCLAWQQVPFPTEPLPPPPPRCILAVTQPVLELLDQVILPPKTIY